MTIVDTYCLRFSQLTQNQLNIIILLYRLIKWKIYIQIQVYFISGHLPSSFPAAVRPFRTSPVHWWPTALANRNQFRHQPQHPSPRPFFVLWPFQQHTRPHNYYYAANVIWCSEQRLKILSQNCHSGNVCSLVCDVGWPDLKFSDKFDFSCRGFPLIFVVRWLSDGVGCVLVDSD